jgi:hypothetical protein
MNDVVKVNANGLAALKSLRAGLRSVAAKLPDATGSQYLRMGKDGSWVFGKDDNVVQPGTTAMINVMSIQHGYSAWTNKQPGQGKNELRGEVMRPVSTALPHVSELEQFKDADWKDQMAVDIKLIDGKHKGLQLTYKASSRGALSALRSLLDAVSDRLDADEPYCFPVVEIDSDSYKHSTYGKTFVPKLDIVGWGDMDGGIIYDREDADEEVREIAPPVQETEEPTRRRRRV